MSHAWITQLKCATHCFRCAEKLAPDSPRILSAYDHEAICMDCKHKEEARPDYEEVSQNVAAQCLLDSESGVGDPKGYCYHHFYPFHCT